MKALQFTGSLPRYALTLALGRVSRRAYWGGLSCLELRDIPEPELPGPDWAVVRTRYAGICGSDIGLIRLETSPTASAFSSFPFTIGHENTGRLEKVGANLPPDLGPGRRVVVDPLLPCSVRGIDPPCPPCRAGEFGHCENFALGGLAPGLLIGGCRDTGGSWSPFFLAHKDQIFPVPDDVSDEAAALTEPLAVSLHAVARAVRHGAPASGREDTTLVIGGGVIGLGVVAALRYLGDRSRIIVLARHEHQAKIARVFGASEVVLTSGPWAAPKTAAPEAGEARDRLSGLAGWEERLGLILGTGFHRPLLGRPIPSTGAGRVFECAGSVSALDAALRFAAPGGEVVLAGLAATPKGIDWSFIWRKELRILGTFCYGLEAVGQDGRPTAGRGQPTFRMALDLLASGRHDFGGLITHHFRLEDYRKAIATVLDKRSSKVIKAVFDFG